MSRRVPSVKEAVSRLVSLLEEAPRDDSLIQLMRWRDKVLQTLADLKYLEAVSRDTTSVRRERL